MASARLVRSLSGLAAVVALGLAAPAFAQDKAVAESLFNAGKTAMDAGDYKTACKNFAESQRQDPSQGTLLNLGRCNELQGKLASAWSYYKEAARMAQLKGDADRAEAGRKLAAELEPKLSKLTVSIAAPTPGLVVARIRKDDGERVEIGGGVMGVAIDVDAGAYTIEASAPGHKKWTGEVTVGANADKQSVAIPALEAGEDPGAATPGATEPPAGGEEGGLNGLTIAGFVVGGVGVVGLVVGAITGLSASSTASGAEDDPSLCPNKKCTSAGLDEIDSAKSSATISTVGFIAGGVLVAGGATMIILGMSQGGDAKSDASARTIHIAKDVELQPVAGPQGGGMWMSGAF